MDTDTTTMTAEATPTIADAFDHLRDALYARTDDSTVDIDRMQAKFEAREAALEARLAVLEQGLIAATTPRKAAPVDDIRPGAGTMVSSPTPVDAAPPLTPTPAVLAASTTNVLSTLDNSEPAPAPATVATGG